jgi:uncharacterized protein (DUF1800 family)
MPLPEYDGILDLKRAAHLLRRATFGATKSQIDDYAKLTPVDAITQLFHATLPDPILPPDTKTGLPWFNTPESDANSEDSDLQNYFKSWFIGQMMSEGIPSDLSLAYSTREKLVFFLHSHFTCIQSKVADSRAMYFQNQLFRFFSRDGLLNSLPEINFKELTVKVSIDNAMLRLLDGNLNVKGSPNENYARELLELYSIGRGLEGTLPSPTGPGDYILFTEEDVQATAKVLSGWELNDDLVTRDPITNLPQGKVRGGIMNASAHDNDPKTFSSRFNTAVIQGDPSLMNGGNATQASSLDEIRQLIDLIYSKPETAKNICWKIYRFFVYAPHTPQASLDIDNAIITEMANTLVANGYKIQPVIENLLRSQHFYEAGAGDVKDDNFGGIIKSPLDLIVGTLRAFSIQLPSMTTQTAEFYETTGYIQQQLEYLGMKFYEPYDVAGYECYHQYPIYHRSWITPNYLARRYEFVRNVVTKANAEMFTVNVYDYVRANFAADAAASRDLVIELTKYFLPIADNLSFDDATDNSASLTAKRLNYFRNRLLQQFDEDYWYKRWGLEATDLREQLEFLFNALLQSPEYQLA